MAWTQVTGRRLRGELPRRLLQHWRQSSSSSASSASKREEVPSSSQLARLALVTGVPFVGFGIADNGIMILAGDAIDSTIGVTLGLSTLAAAGLGNLLSDVVGIGAGDVIERFCYRMGLREPPLSAAQQTMNRTRHVKTGASVLGIAVGCIIGMFPLLFLSDRKKLYFNDKELELYESVFQPFGVNPHHFFDLLHSAKWRTVEPGAPIVQAGAVMDRVVLVHSGRLDSFGTRDDGSKFFLYSYFGKTSLGVNPEEEDPSTKRGSIIGGTALVNMSVIRDPYPNTVVASKRSEVLEWNIAELRKQMKEDKAIEAAVFSTLYLDLVEGLQRQRKDQQRLASVDRELKDQALHEFSILIKAVISDGMVHPSERQMVREFMATNDISRADLGNLIEDLGWTLEDWDKGVKADSRNHTLEEKIKNIPEMLRSANIRSRITESDEKVSK
mmetsp:Transcript_17780/g.51918  ORF Transcript_17780/g.51918 Transcript_17780/m.51918 type:complete len:443 (-) Transcript_17780:136-1464(-)